MEDRSGYFICLRCSGRYRTESDHQSKYEPLRYQVMFSIIVNLVKSGQEVQFVTLNKISYTHYKLQATTIKVCKKRPPMSGNASNSCKCSHCMHMSAPVCAIYACVLLCACTSKFRLTMKHNKALSYFRNTSSSKT